MSPALRYVVTASVLTLIPIGWHFGTVFGYWGEAPVTRADFFIRLGVIVAISIVANIIVSILMASSSGEEEFEPDEREKKVLQRAELSGYYVLAAGVVITIWFVFTPLTPMQTANALLASFALSEVFKLLVGVYFLRTGV